MVKDKEALCGLATAILAFLMLISIPWRIQAEPPAGRFFLMGDGIIHIRNVRTGHEAKAAILSPDGSLNEDGFKEIDGVFEFPTSEKGEHISPRLIFMLDYFSDLTAPGRVINLTSGYRNHEYNSGLRNAGGNVAKTSTHIDGMALDFNLEGVNGKELWEIIKAKNCCGVGYYGSETIHLDSARPRFWEAATSKVRTGESDYNRRIYLSTDYDRYKAGDTLRFSLSSVSDFGFGIKQTVALVDDADGNNTVAVAQVKHQEDSDCIMINTRDSSRSIPITIPHDLRQGRYRVRIDFCRSPFDQMPQRTVSNEIEIVGSMP
ncbi:MAG: YcbK family protein [Syntrophobacteraceae bacterium]